MAKEYLTVDGKLITVDGELVQVPDAEQLNDIADENDTYATQNQALTDDIEELIVNGVIDGSPRDVYDNLEALQTAYPSGASGVYLTSDNGHWYYWNGSAWTDGGVYQAQATEYDKNLDELSDNAVENMLLTKLFTDNNNVEVITPQWNGNGNFISYTNTLVTDGSGGGVSYSNPISLKKGDILVFYAEGYLDRINILSKLNADGSYSQLIQSQDSNYHWFKYVATEEISVVICTYGYSSFKAYKLFDLMKSTNQQIIKASELNWVNDKFITFDGKIADSSGFGYTNHIYIKKNTKITFYGKGYEWRVAMISKVDNKRSNNYTPVVTSNYQDQVYSYVTDSDGFYAFSSNLNQPRDIYLQLNYTDVDIVKNMSLSLFESFGVVGDSFASGELYYNGGYVDKKNISWGQILARKNGIICTNYSQGGLTTRSWLGSQWQTNLLNDNPKDLYILALGINDVYSLGINYLGTIDDIKTDYTQNPDTFYGNYGKIIAIIKNHAPNAKIVISTMAATNGDYPSFNYAIRVIAWRFAISCIRQDIDPYFQSNFYKSKMVGSHPIGINYSGMANAIENMIKNEMVSTNYFDNYLMHD